MITREADLDANLSFGTETYLPSRLLYGLLPAELLDTFEFWQERGRVSG